MSGDAAYYLLILQDIGYVYIGGRTINRRGWFWKRYEVVDGPNGYFRDPMVEAIFYDPEKAVKYLLYLDEQRKNIKPPPPPPDKRKP